MIDGGLRQLFRRYLPEPDYATIETGLVSLGVPDLNACLNGAEVWIEMKVCSGWSVTIRPEQSAWAERRIRHGGRVFLAVRRKHDGGPRKGPPVDELWIFHGRDAATVRKEGLLSGPPLLRSSGGPQLWDWRRVSQILFNKP